MEPLLPAFRRELRARAHHLNPVVSIGHHGLTPAVLHETDVALTAHELVKVRVLVDDRAEREALLGRICDALDCAPVQRIGKLLVLWRPRPKDVEAGRPAHARHPNRAARGRETPAPRGSRGRSMVADAAPAPRTARARRVSDAPSGVPRAALPRRRRGTG